MGKKLSSGKPEVPPTIQGALVRLGMHAPSGSTVVVTASAKTKASPADVWRVWSEIEKWAIWSKPLHSSARWLEKRSWVVGAQFEQVLNYGFPLGKSVSVETVKEVNPNQSVAWWKEAKGVKSCHIWFFEPLQEGGTQITKTEVFVGPALVLGKLSGAKKRWSELFQQSVNGLIKAVDRADSNSGAQPTEPVSKN